MTEEEIRAEVRAVIERHRVHMRKLRRDLAIRIPVAIVVGAAFGLLGRLILWLTR